MNAIKVELHEWAGGWEAFKRGDSSPILRPVPGNTRPAHAAWWSTREEALAELPILLDGEVALV